MALSFTRLSWLWLGGKEKEHVSNGSVTNSINPLGDWGLGLRGEAENLKFYSVNGIDRTMPSSSLNRKVKKKWTSREDRSRGIDKEYDVVLVPSDGVCLSGSESDDSDWSIGWLEPHAPDFQSDDEVDDSFAVLVPCYRLDCKQLNEDEEETTAAGKTSAVFDKIGYLERWHKIHGAMAFLSPEFLKLPYRSAVLIATTVCHS
ncbi:hypothetical protein PHJA_001344800 [Phtheirospermum japonicum]|uniref:Uncharacterized protein n=1 Tax=Phtheirospermum japonicum TaxID=374723 RepID=A0A830BVK3_9LAMI|nr:hypothetical protein PHJA_001344800 [Phtheirospermum japonicum]